MSRTDYNKLASTYDKRYENNNLDKIEAQLINLIITNNYKAILEAGCGTGRWIKSLNTINTIVFGLDYSLGMLKIANSGRSLLNLVNADAINFPFKDNSFDMIFCVNAIHHFSDKELFVSECRRTLNLNGMLAIIGADPYVDKNWYVYNYFESVYQNDLKRFLPVEKTKSILDRTGFTKITVTVVDKIYSKRIGSEVFNDPFLQKNHSSQLADLTDYEYENGIKKMEDQINKNPNIEFETSIKFYLISALKN
jgi:ubiquinone/menaquinone biosynthesis C-methylase UbiE